MSDANETRRAMAAAAQLSLMQRRAIVPLPRPEFAAAHVLIDGAYYCSFHTRESAVEAERLWRQNWAAVSGKSIMVTYASPSAGWVN